MGYLCTGWGSNLPVLCPLLVVNTPFPEMGSGVGVWGFLFYPYIFFAVLGHSYPTEIGIQPKLHWLDNEYHKSSKTFDIEQLDILPIGTT